MSDPTPCGWAPVSLCCPGWDAIPQQTRDLATEVATDIVWRLSGMRFGLCEVILRPCAEPCMYSTYQEAYAYNYVEGGGMPWMRPYIQGGQWYNVGCGCSGGCSCTSLSRVWLPPRADSIIEVKLDGVVLPDTSWELQQGYLVRTDGLQWPMCQDMTEPATEVGTFQVTYRQGRRVPAGGNLAAGALACEIAKACAGLECRLPDRVTDITREGVTMTMLDPQDFLDNGLTGIREVDQWLAAVNPFRQKSPSQVWSPDLPNPRRV